jgi:hypothetical protein
MVRTLTFTNPCIASTTNKMQRFLDLFISINCCTWFRRFLCPSSGAQKSTYSFRYCQTNTAVWCYRGWDETRFLRPSSGAQYCTYDYVKYYQINTAACCYRGWDWTLVSFHPWQQQAIVLVWQFLTLYVQFCAPDDGRRNVLKHVEQFTEINRLRKRCILLVVI